EPNETTAFNRLQINVQVDYQNNLDEKDKWSQNFSFFENFASDQNLLDVQDDLINLIYDQIVEDIFNKAFTNW
ncbi:MAG: LPS assembly lipoprotein LptE, partial [Bacteroidota bacterium]